MSATVSHEIAVLVVVPASKTPQEPRYYLTTSPRGPFVSSLSLARIPVPIKPVNLSMFPT
jgi:hypothetical protein